MGNLGGAEHQKIVDEICFNFPNVIMQAGWSGQICVADELSMLGCLGQIGGPRKGRKVPDIVVVHNGGALVVEVGIFRPDKWMDRPVIWVTFSRMVRVFNWSGDAFVKDVAEAISLILNGEERKLVAFDDTKLRDRLLDPAEAYISYKKDDDHA